MPVHVAGRKTNDMQKSIKKVTGFILTLLSTAEIWAQDKNIDVDIDVNKHDSNWYQQPWVWIVGVAVFILLLVAILKSGSKKD